jgi:hypothetical protein
MLDLANASVSVLRGETEDEWGDTVDATTAAYTGVPAAIVESARVTTDPATQVPRTIRSISCVMPGWADVLNTDRLQDDATGCVYAIITVSEQPSLGYPPDTLLTLKRVTGAGK